MCNSTSRECSVLAEVLRSPKSRLVYAVRDFYHLTTIIFSTNKHIVADHYFNFPHVLFSAL